MLYITGTIVPVPTLPGVRLDLYQIPLAPTRTTALRGIMAAKEEPHKIYLDVVPC